MTFLNPLVLLGLAAAAIPLIIHLFNFRRPKRVDFSSLAFLKELQKSTMQRVRIKQWLLLALRTLAIATLVFAFARPTLQSGLAGTLGGRASSSVAIVIDNSLSMTVRDGGGEYMTQARDLASAIVDQLAPGDEIFVIGTADRSAVTPAVFKNRGAALDAVASLEARPSAAVTSHVLARAASLLETAVHLNKEIYLISDLQRTTLIDSARAHVPDEIRTILLPIGDRKHSNVAVTGVEIASRIVEVGQPVRIDATIVNYGDEPIEDYVASIYLEGERVAQATVDLPPGIPATAVFTTTPQRRGWLSGLVQIEEDAFDHDNVRHFTLHIPERRKVLVVRGEEQRTDYIELALSPRLAQGRVAFDLETVSETALAATGLGAFDAVILLGVRTLSSGEVSALGRYVEEGGGVLLFPSARAAAQDYNALLESLNGGAFSGFSGELGSSRPIAAFERVDLEHVLFEGVFGRQARDETRVESPDVYHAMNYSPSTGSEQTLIQLSNGFPFLQEVRHGRGVVFLVAVAPDPAWSDLPVRGLFIPLLYRSMYYLSASESVAGEQLTVGKGGELRIAGVGDVEPLRLIAPDGGEITPEQRNLFGAMLLSIDAAALDEAGLYDVRVGERLLRRIAVNLDSRESNLETFSAGEAQRRLSDVTGSRIRTVESVAAGMDRVLQALHEERTGRELWNVFLMLALFFLAAEMVVGRYWKPETVSA
jgi:hypothetical protein